MNYNQFCPIAKAAEILGERWTILILREILMGGRRFNTLQRGLGDISPALLTKRLKQLEEQNMLVRRKIPGQKGYEYFPSDACEALPVEGRLVMRMRVAPVVGSQRARRSWSSQLSKMRRRGRSVRQAWWMRRSWSGRSRWWTPAR